MGLAIENISKKPWEDFNRMSISGWSDNFYGCVDKDGFWFDSSVSFATAIHWVSMHHGHHEFTTKEEIEFMAGEIVDSKRKGSECSIIHSSMLRKMYEAGLIK